MLAPQHGAPGEGNKQYRGKVDESGGVEIKQT